MVNGATPGSILYRQRGTKIYPGENTLRGKDDTIFATASGVAKVLSRWKRSYGSENCRC